MTNVPILYIIFNRINTVKDSLESIRKAKPRKLYIAADGPRPQKSGEAEKVKEVREFVLSNIDWDCEVKTRFQDKNIGCKNGVSSAIYWFFENEEMGIILEDDCVPIQSFYKFCEKLLNKYKYDERIGQISGFNRIADKIQIKNSYFYSTGGSIWGWATWRRVAKDFEKFFNKDVSEIEKSMSDFSDNLNEAKKIANNLKLVNDGKLDSWANHWGAMLKSNSRLSIVPANSLIENVGFGKDATHTKTEGIKWPKTKDLDVENLIHPEFISPDKEKSKMMANFKFPISFYLNYILNKFR